MIKHTCTSVYNPSQQKHFCGICGLRNEPELVMVDNTEGNILTVGDINPDDIEWIQIDRRCADFEIPITADNPFGVDRRGRKIIFKWDSV